MLSLAYCDEKIQVYVPVSAIVNGENTDVKKINNLINLCGFILVLVIED